MGQHLGQRELNLLDDTEEVEIETMRSDTQKPYRTTIWVVVVGSDAYVRSVNAEEGHWYQQLMAQAAGTIHADGKQISVHGVHVADALMCQVVSEAYQHKYLMYPQDVAWIVAPEARRTTLRFLLRLR